DLMLVAILERDNPADVLCAHTSWAELPDGAVVGTSSPRRQAQLKALRPDLTTVDIRGNVDTRLGLIGSDVDAVVLAAAGLDRLGRGAEAAYEFPIADMVPAPGQAAIAIEMRTDALEMLRSVVAALDHQDTRTAVTAERAV